MKTRKQGLASKEIFFFAKEVPPPCFVSRQNESNLLANQIQGKYMIVSKKIIIYYIQLQEAIYSYNDKIYFYLAWQHTNYTKQYNLM